MKNSAYNDIFIEEEFLSVRNKVIDKILLISVVFGSISASATFFRDSEIGVNYVNSIANFSIILFAFIVWLKRDVVSIHLKSGLIVGASLLVAVKSSYIMGPYSQGFYYLSHCLVVLIMSQNVKKSIYIMIFFNIPIFVIAYLFIDGQLNVTMSLDNSVSEPSIWFNTFTSYFVAFLVFGPL